MAILALTLTIIVVYVDQVIFTRGLPQMFFFMLVTTDTEDDANDVLPHLITFVILFLSILLPKGQKGISDLLAVGDQARPVATFRKMADLGR